MVELYVDSCMRLTDLLLPLASSLLPPPAVMAVFWGQSLLLCSREPQMWHPTDGLRGMCVCVCVWMQSVVVWWYCVCTDCVPYLTWVRWKITSLASRAVYTAWGEVGHVRLGTSEDNIVYDLPGFTHCPHRSQWTYLRPSWWRKDWLIRGLMTGAYS